MRRWTHPSMQPYRLPLRDHTVACPGRAIAYGCLIVLAGCAGSESLQEPPVTLGIHHGEPRPACRQIADPSRTPWALPQVVAADWGASVKLGDPICTACPEDAVEISPDGSVLYFYWSPVVNAGADELLHGTTGTYVSHRIGHQPGDFDAPSFFELRRGASDGACDGELSFTPAGDEVYFHSTRAENTGYQQSPPVDDFLDIYVASIESGIPGVARNLGSPVNSIHLDGEHGLHPSGHQLFLASNRPGGEGGTDLWIATREASGWSTPVNPGAPLNSPGNELQPAFAAGDSTTLYFVSDRDGPASIYRSRSSGAAWTTPEMVVTGYVGEPSLTADGQLLYFVHVLVDAQGVFGSDIWYVRKH